MADVLPHEHGHVCVPENHFCSQKCFRFIDGIAQPLSNTAAADELKDVWEFGQSLIQFTGQMDFFYWIFFFPT